MKIAGHDYMIEQNYRLQNELLSGISKNVEPVQSVPQVNNTNPSFEDSDGVVLQISESAVRNQTSEQRATATDGFAPTSFSTTSQEDFSTTNEGSGQESVLSRYRFFVQSTQYEDADGMVRRIFE